MKKPEGQLFLVSGGQGGFRGGSGRFQGGGQGVSGGWGEGQEGVGLLSMGFLGKTQ